MLKKVVVVAPVSLLGTWKKEVKKWLGEERLSPKIAIGSRENVNIRKITFILFVEQFVFFLFR